MSAKFALRSILIFCIIMLISTLIVGSTVSAQEITQDDPILGSTPEQSLQGGSPVPGGPGFISVSPLGFMSFNPVTFPDYNNNGWLISNSGGLGYYFAPVNLPHGAILTQVLFFYYDFEASAHMIFSLYRANMSGDSLQEVSNATSLGEDGYGYVESTIYQPVIDNQLYSYFVRVEIPGSFGEHLSLINVRIDYGYPSYLPTVQK